MLDRKFFTHDVGAKLLSLLAAVLVWSSIRLGVLSGEGRDVRELSAVPHATETRAFTDLPITVLTTAEDLHGFKVAPATVSVTLTGDQHILSDIKARDVQVFVNLLEMPESQNVRREIKVHLPLGVQLQKIEPREVQVERIDPGTAK